MSNSTNDLLVEWACELMESAPSTIAEKAIQRDLDSGDMEALRYTVSFWAAQLAQEHFYNYEVLGY